MINMKSQRSYNLLRVVIVTISLASLISSSSDIGTSTFTAPGAFPTSLYSKYYNSPTATSAQVQPVISDSVTVSFQRKRHVHII